MFTEQKPSASSEPKLRMQNPVEPLHPRVLLESAISRIEPEGTVVYAKGTPHERHSAGFDPHPVGSLSDHAWAYQALDIADVLYRRLGKTWEPEATLYNLARYLNAFRSDPSLLQAALSLLATDNVESFCRPQTNLDLLWRERLIAMRQR